MWCILLWEASLQGNLLKSESELRFEWLDRVICLWHASSTIRIFQGRIEPICRCLQVDRVYSNAFQSTSFLVIRYPWHIGSSFRHSSSRRTLKLLSSRLPMLYSRSSTNFGVYSVVKKSVRLEILGLEGVASEAWAEYLVSWARRNSVSGV